MTATTMKRGARPPRHKPVPPRKIAGETIALPLTARALRRNVVFTVSGLVAITGGIMASLAGVPQRQWAEFVRSTAQAGFEVRHVEITGTHEMDRLPIYDAALSGPSNAMIKADLPQIRARLLALPWVADASVGRRLPDTLTIQIVERRPVALWQHQRRFALIDITGQLLTSKGLDRFGALPVVIGPGANVRVRELLNTGLRATVMALCAWALIAALAFGAVHLMSA